MAASRIMKQWYALIDKATTIVCINAAGQLRDVNEPFNTLNGDYDAPPAHIHCRSLVIPYVKNAVNAQRDEANAELMRRPLKQRDPRKMKMPPKPPSLTKAKRKPKPPTRARRARRRA